MRTSFKKKIQFHPAFQSVQNLLFRNHINTICHSARCPNISECYAKKKLTFLIMGPACTRNCLFCDVKKGIPQAIDQGEIDRIKAIIRKLSLKYVIITSVTRDDLEDGGASYFAFIVEEIKKDFPDVKIEILVPDFRGKRESLETIAFSDCDVIGHNIETIKRLYPSVRPRSDFRTVLGVLERIKKINPAVFTKSGFMLGLGESMEEIKELIYTLFQAKVDAITIGQYFQPSKKNLPVQKFYSDEEFQQLEKMARETGFRNVLSGRFVRSSSFEIR